VVDRARRRGIAAVIPGDAAGIAAMDRTAGLSPAKLGAGTWQLALGRAVPAAGKLRVQVVATDRAGNRSPVVVRSATVR
jgi:hypothetical protein